jgi:hypothetical protein
MLSSQLHRRLIGCTGTPKPTVLAAGCASGSAGGAGVLLLAAAALTTLCAQA